MTKTGRIIKAVPQYNLRFGDTVLVLDPAQYPAELSGCVCEIYSGKDEHGKSIKKIVLLMCDEVEHD